MRSIPLFITLLVASPAFGQPHVYTNADLGKPLLSWTSRPKLTPAEAAAILLASSPPPPIVARPAPMLARNIEPPWPRSASMTPWDWPTPRIDRRLDGSSVLSSPHVYGQQIYGPMFGQPWYGPSPVIGVYSRPVERDHRKSRFERVPQPVVLGAVAAGRTAGSGATSRRGSPPSWRHTPRQ